MWVLIILFQEVYLSCNNFHILSLSLSLSLSPLSLPFSPYSLPSPSSPLPSLSLLLPPLKQVLFLTGGIVLLTLLINASTIRYLLDSLGLLDISNARRLTMATAICRINESKSKAIRLLKSDRFLVDAHWEVVQEKTIIENPFLEEGMIGVG